MEIHWQGLGEIPEEQIENAEERIRALANGHQDLIDLRIVGKSSQHHRHGDKEVHIACQARGKDLVSARSGPDLGLALDEALEAFERQVRELRDRRRQARTRAGSPPS